MRIGALEAGGTKMVCAVGREDGTILDVHPHHHAGGNHSENYFLF